MSLLTPLLWSLLPSQLTHLLLPYLSSVLPALFPPAPRGSQVYQRNFRWAFSGVVLLYLAWQFARDGGGNGGAAAEDWYALLGVDVGVDEEGLRRAFRGLSRTYHPDRAGPGYEHAFILVRQAYEVLSDPVKRYAYDRFGPDITTWRCASIREYTRTGILHSTGFYLVSGGFMLLLSGKAREGAYWRHTLFLILLSLELSLVLSPFPPAALPPHLLASLHSSPLTHLPLLLSPSSPPFLLIRQLHRLFTALSIAVSQLAGVWADEKPDEAKVAGAVWALVRSVEAEAVASFQAEIVPLLSLSPDPVELERAVQAEMEQVLVDRALSTHPQIRPLWTEAIQRERERERRQRSSRPLAPTGVNFQPPIQAAEPRHQGGPVARPLPQDLQLHIAQSIPLPPSPPPTPRLGPMRLDAG